MRILLLLVTVMLRKERCRFDLCFENRGKTHDTKAFAILIESQRSIVIQVGAFAVLIESQRRDHYCNWGVCCPDRESTPGPL